MTEIVIMLLQVNANRDRWDKYNQTAASFR